MVKRGSCAAGSQQSLRSPDVQRADVPVADGFLAPGVSRDAVADIPVQGFLSDHIYLAPQQVFQICHKARWEPGGVNWPNFYQKVHVTLRAGFAARDRAKDTHVVCAMPLGNAQNVLAFFFQQLVNAPSARTSILEYITNHLAVGLGYEYIERGELRAGLSSESLKRTCRSQHRRGRFLLWTFDLCTVHR
jgi:hypothetical protein